MKEAENEPHEGKRKPETLWPILRIHHQMSRYIFELYVKKKQISKSKLYIF
jgi:bud site selection protein 31